VQFQHSSLHLGISIDLQSQVKIKGVPWLFSVRYSARGHLDDVRWSTHLERILLTALFQQGSCRLSGITEEQNNAALSYRLLSICLQIPSIKRVRSLLAH
jgi:hypothetical protein